MPQLCLQGRTAAFPQRPLSYIVHTLCLAYIYIRSILAAPRPRDSHPILSGTAACLHSSAAKRRPSAQTSSTDVRAPPARRRLHLLTTADNLGKNRSGSREAFRGREFAKKVEVAPPARSRALRHGLGTSVRCVIFSLLYRSAAKAALLVWFFRFCTISQSCPEHRPQAQKRPPTFSQVSGMPKKEARRLRAKLGAEYGWTSAEKPGDRHKTPAQTALDPDGWYKSEKITRGST